MLCLTLTAADDDRVFSHVFPVRHSVLQGPLENDLVVHVALVAESQRYEVRVGGAFLWGARGGGAQCFLLQY